MTKLEIKTLIAERYLALDGKIKEDNMIYQIIRLMRLNSNNIPPNILLRINRRSQKSALELYRKTLGITTYPESFDDKVLVKKFENKFKKETIRTYLNKLFTAESKKFTLNPEKYIGPDFV